MDGAWNLVTPTAQPSSGETIEMLFKTAWVRSMPVGVAVVLSLTLVPPLPLRPGRRPGVPKITIAISMMASVAARAGKPARKWCFLPGGSVRDIGVAEGVERGEEATA